tara:strand:- start:762 stop:947 length:186 start_codon:yes stop_codon:yes gene_type:complete
MAGAFCVLQAVLFFSGPVLAIQLVFSAAIFGLCLLIKQQSEGLATQSRSGHYLKKRHKSAT